MGRNGPLGSLRALDAFSRPLEDVRIRSASGAALTLLSFFLIFILTLSSWLDYRKVHLTHNLEVDKSRGEKLSVGVDITFPRVPCYLLSIDVMDISGEHLDDVKHDIKRTRLDHLGKVVVEAKGGLKGEADRLAAQRGKGFCGSCYGGEPPAGGCCNTCEEVREAYARKGWSFSDPDHIDQCISEHWTEKMQAQNKEGCRVTGKLHVNKVVGNFHLSPGRSFSRNNVHTHDIVPYLKGSGEEHHDFGHVIHTFSFGAEDEFNVPPPTGLDKSAKQRLDIVDPLTGVKADTDRTEYMFQYFTKVVATEYRTLNGERQRTFQYSATSYERDLAPHIMGGPAKGGAHAGAGVSNEHGTHSPHQVQHGFMGIPGVFFNYEISPLRTIHTEYRMPFSRFLSALCSIVGGVLTLAGLLDAAIWHYRIRLSARQSQGGVGVTSGGIANGYGGGGSSYGGYGKEGYGMAGRGGKLV
ncbi:unnamed protein product [Sympodiomycopsis kandeliae]